MAAAHNNMERQVICFPCEHNSLVARLCETVSRRHPGRMKSGPRRAKDFVKNAAEVFQAPQKGVRSTIGKRSEPDPDPEILGAHRPGSCRRAHHAHEIQDAGPEPVPYPVLGLPVATSAVIDRNCTDCTAAGLDERWQEPVHVIECRQLEKTLTPEYFQAAAGIANTVMQEGRPYAVCDTG